MAYKTITLLGDGVRKEALANGAIYPGYLVYKSSAADFSAHGTAGGSAQTMFAVENDLEGKNIDTVYANNTRMLACVFRRGDEVLALLAEGQNASIGSFLESSGDGYLRVAEDPDSATGGQYNRNIVGIALEALDLSQSSGVEGAEALSKSRIKIEIL